MSQQLCIDTLLEHARTTLGADLAVVTRFVGEDIQVQHVAGTLAQVSPRSQLRDLPAALRRGTGSPLDAPIRLADGTAYGTLYCVSAGNPSAPTDLDLRVMSFIAGVIGTYLDHANGDVAEAAAITSRVRALIDAGGPAMEFQAVFTVPAMQVRGWEALARFPAGWGGPDQWFADAASVGLGVELELSAIANALAELPSFRPGSRIGINASPATVTDPRLIGLLRQFPPSALLVEITEHSEINDYTLLTEAIAELRDLGIPIAADDAGAGYCGLRHLIELRPTGIKLDRAIIADLDRDPARQAIVTAMVAFANDIDAVLLAEGVETHAELDVLAQLGVHVAQGYLLHRPQPSARASRVTDAVVPRRIPGRADRSMLAAAAS